jgi:hypothetical protein
MDTILSIVGEAAPTLGKVLSEASSKKNLPELLRAYTTFYTAFNLLVAYSHESGKSDAVAEQVGVIRRVLEMYSQEGVPDLANRSRNLAAAPLTQPVKKPAKEKHRKGADDPTDTALVALGHEADRMVGGGPAEEDHVLILGGGAGAPDRAYVLDTARDAQVRQCQWYQLVLRDLHGPEYLTRVLPGVLRSGLGTDLPGLLTRLRYTPTQWVNESLKRLGLETHLRALELELSTIVAGFSTEQVHSINDVILAVQTLDTAETQELVAASRRVFQELDPMSNSQLPTATAQAIQDLDAVTKSRTAIGEYRVHKRAVIGWRAPAEMSDAVPEILTQPSEIDTLPTDVAGVRALIEEYHRRWMAAQGIVKAGEEWYHRLLDGLVAMRDHLREIERLRPTVQPWRRQLVEAYVRAVVLQNLWQLRRPADHQEYAQMTSVVSRLDSVFPLSQPLFDGGLHLRSVVELARTY